MTNSTNILNSILKHLRSVRIDQAALIAQEWLEHARDGEITEILATCPQAERPRLVTLLRDLLTGHPCLLGAPALILANYATTEGLEGSNAYEAGFVLPNELRLPMPCDTLAPLNSLRFLGWAPEGLHTRNRAIELACAYRSIPWERIAASVAVFEYDPGMVLAYDEIPRIESAWWGTLFTQVLDVATISLCDLPLLPYPDAIEVANQLGAAALGLQPKSSPYFANAALIARCKQQASMLLPPSSHHAHR